jgi:DNA-binding NarL/FixJ family response regulator
VLTSWPLVGRAQELERVSELLHGGACRGVVFAGAAGVGKTRLAREALAAARAVGFAGDWAVGTHSAASIPFGALSHLVPADRGAASEHLDMLRTAVGHLARRADGRRLVLAVDDAHLLDDGSATLVRHLAEASDTFLIATVRSREPTPDGIVALWKDELAERLEVGPLPAQDVDRLLAIAVNGPVDDATAQHVALVTQGNALYLRELVIGALDTGVLRKTGGVWRLLGPLTPPPRLVELIEARLGRLDGQARLGLELLAFGEPLGADTLKRLVPLATLEQAERKGLIMLEQQQRRVQARLAHPLYSEVLRRNAPAIRARSVCRRLAETATATGIRRADDVLRVVTWSLDAGAECDAAILSAASRRALRRFDYALAERLARKAVEVGGGLAASWALGDALIGRGDSAGGETVLAELAPRCRGDAARARLALLRASNLVFGLGQVAAAEDLLRAAAAQTADPQWRGELAAFQATCSIWGGRTGDALAGARSVIEQDVGGRASLSALVIGGLTAALCGRGDEALAYAARGEQLVGKYADDLPLSPLQLAVNRCLADLLAGRLARAEADARAGYQRALREHWSDACATWAQWLGHIARHRGQPRSALGWLRKSAVLLRENDRFGSLPAVLADCANAAAVAGDPHAASDMLRESEEHLRGPFLLHVEQARPWVSAARGERAAAVQLAIAAADRGRQRGELGWAVVAMHDIARLGNATAAARRFGAITGQVDGEAVTVYTAHVDALIARDGPRLDDVAGRFDALGFTLLAAEAAAEAAQAHRAEGRVASALASTKRAKQLAGLCEGARTPALELLDPLPLTPRERQIATLAASGLSSRAIARDLVLSARTIDNHLSNIYAKMGITGRTQLADRLP